MTREEFVKRSYKPYMILYDTRLKEDVMLLAVDFETELMTLQLMHESEYKYDSKYNEFHEHIRFIQFKKKENKLKVL